MGGAFFSSAAFLGSYQLTQSTPFYCAWISPFGWMLLFLDQQKLGVYLGEYSVNTSAACYTLCCQILFLLFSCNSHFNLFSLFSSGGLQCTWCTKVYGLVWKLHLCRLQEGLLPHTGKYGVWNTVFKMTSVTVDTMEAPPVLRDLANRHLWKTASGTLAICGFGKGSLSLSF